MILRKDSQIRGRISRIVESFNQLATLFPGNFRIQDSCFKLSNKQFKTAALRKAKEDSIIHMQSSWEKEIISKKKKKKKKEGTLNRLLKSISLCSLSDNAKKVPTQ